MTGDLLEKSLDLADALVHVRFIQRWSLKSSSAFLIRDDPWKRGSTDIAFIHTIV
jgi:hypothetical protein